MIDGEDGLAAAYSERGVPTEWEDITPPTFDRAFRLHYRALPSPGDDEERPVGWDDAEKLIHDPVQALIDGGVISEELDGEGKRIDPRISTMVVNHEKTLKRFIMHAFVAVSKNPRTVGITIVKEERPEPRPDPHEQPGP